MVCKITIHFGVLILLSLCLFNKLSAAIDGSQRMLNSTNSNKDLKQKETSTIPQKIEITMDIDGNHTMKKENVSQRANVEKKHSSMNLHTLRSITRNHTRNINYLMKNLLNETDIVHILDNYCTKTGLTRTNWRDLNILFLDLILIIWSSYFLIMFLRQMICIRNISSKTNRFALDERKQKNCQEQP